MENLCRSVIKGLSNLLIGGTNRKRDILVIDVFSNSSNRLSTETNANGAVRKYTYDPLGNVTSITDSINGNIGVNNARQYDALNRLTVNSQGNKRVDYGYNALGQVTNKKRFSYTIPMKLIAR